MKKAISVAVAYTVAMAAGLYYVKNYQGVAYSQPTFLEHFFWILLGLASATLLYSLVFKKEVAIPFRKDSKWTMYLIVMVPVVLAFIVMLTVMFKPTWTFFAPIIATLLVGIGEETAFRKILFGALLKDNANKGKTVASAILISALAFSALHAVNVLGGQTISDVAVQLVLTFLAGILFAGLYLQTKSLLAMIAFHWLWDALVFMGLEKKLSIIVVAMPILLVMQIVIGLIILNQYKGIKAKEVVKLAE